MEESRRTIQNLVIALTAPFVVVFMVILAILAGLAYYLKVLSQSFWLLCRDLPQWVMRPKKKPPLPGPHFLNVPARSKAAEK